MTDDEKRFVKELRHHAELRKGLMLEPYETLGGVMEQAANMIEKLSADLESDERQYGRDAFGTLVDEGIKLEADRDAWKRRCEAAERDIDHCCTTCQYHYVFFNGCTQDHDCTNPDGGCTNNCDRWHWRGPCEVNEGTHEHTLPQLKKPLTSSEFSSFVRNAVENEDDWLWCVDRKQNSGPGWNKCTSLHRYANITAYGVTWVAFKDRPSKEEVEAIEWLEKRMPHG